MKTVLLGIDLQYDFCNPQGALYVQGANDDVLRVQTLIDRLQGDIDHIVMSMDSHQPIHIAHQVYWRDMNGNTPELFSTISKQSVDEGKWIPQYNKDLVLDYLAKLEATGGVCTIWPPHCILGTRGWSIDESVFASITRWTLQTGCSYELVNKGMHQSTEHYSLFRAAVEYEDVPATLLNETLIARLREFDRILIVGEAADFCVANSLRDLLGNASDLASKIYMLTDCMSYIIPENEETSFILENAQTLGVHFCLSTDI